MKTARAAAFLFALCLAMLTLACADGNRHNELERAARTVTENDLAIMVLPQEELGDEFGDLAITTTSGFLDSEEAAGATIDPDDTADDMERAGYVTGYRLVYVAADVLSVLEAGEGVIRLSTQVTLFRNPSAASDSMTKRLDDYRRLEGTEIADGLILEDTETFAVEGLADEAVGTRGRFRARDAEWYGTTVAFRLEQLVGHVLQYRPDDTNVDSEVQEIARALEQRIEGVLLGDIGGRPVPLP